MKSILLAGLAFIALTSGRATTENSDVLITLRDFPDLSTVPRDVTHAERVGRVFQLLSSYQTPQKRALLSWLRDRRFAFREFYISQQILVTQVSQADRDLLKEFPGVARVDDDLLLKIPAGESVFVPDSSRAVQSNITETGAPRVWQEMGVKGEGVIVGNADTGFSWQHPALKMKYSGVSLAGVDHRYAWHDAITSAVAGGSSCGYNLKAPCDDHGHGTHTMGTVVGDDGVGNQIGMAPEATWIGCRNMDNGVGKVSTYLACFQFFLAPYPMGGDPIKDGDPKHAPHIITNSWACLKSEGCTGNEFKQVMESLVAAGILVVVAAGNEGPGCGTLANPPAVHSAITFSVGAHSVGSHTIASFSNRGPSKFDGAIGPDLSAPGVGIRSSMPGNKYGQMDGTSMAAPHVAGAAALLLSARHDLLGKVTEISDLLRKGAVPKTTSQNCGNVAGTSVPNNTYGYGFLNIWNSLH